LGWGELGWGGGRGEGKQSKALHWCYGVLLISKNASKRKAKLVQTHMHASNSNGLFSMVLGFYLFIFYFIFLPLHDST